jgi:hypothetical protein
VNASTGCTLSLTTVQNITVQQAPTLANAGVDLERCGSGSITLAGNLPAIGTGTWSIVSGTGGSFANINLNNTQFTGAAGQVYTLAWTISNGVCPVSTDNVIVTVTTPPTVFAGTNESICENNVFNFSTQSIGASASNFSSLNWTHTGLGTLFNSSSLTPSYIPQTGETGVITFTLQANPNGTCSFVQSTMQLTIFRTPVIDPVADVIVCSGLPIPAINFTTNAGGGELFVWTNTNTSIGLGASGIGNISSFSTINTTGAALTGLIEVEASRNGCTGPKRTFRITILPEPVVAPVSSITVCPGTPISIPLTSNVPGALIQWTNSMSSIGIGSSGIGSLNFTAASNTTGATIVANFVVTSTKDGCTSLGANQKSFTISIDPTPVMTNTVASRVITVCSGTALNFVPASNVGAATYTWFSNVVGAFTGVSASGTGSITDTPVNTGSTTGIITYTITPQAAGCVGASINFVVTVLPTPSADGVDVDLCTDSGPVNIFINSNPQNVVGTTFSWIADEDANVVGAVDGNGSTINQTLSLSSGTTGQVRYRVTPSANGCPGPEKIITVSLFKRAEVSAGPDLALCADTPSIPLQGSFNFTSGITWSRIVGAGSFSNPNDPVASYTFVNPAEINTTVRLRITANDPDGAGPCGSEFDEMLLRINPLPVVNFTGFPGGAPPQIAENGTPLTLTGNQIGGLFTILPLTSNIGTTVQNPPADQAQFDPNAAELGSNFVTYTYTNLEGCTNQVTREILVNPVTTLNFGILGATINANNEFELCQNSGKSTLVGNPAVGTGQFSEFNGVGAEPEASIMDNAIIFELGAFKINTDILPAGTYLIQYVYRDDNGNEPTPVTKVLQVRPAPIAVITAPNTCIEDDIQFFSTASSVGSPGTIVSWNWTLDVGVSRTSENPLYNYLTAGSPPGNKNIVLMVTASYPGTTLQCSNQTNKTIRVGNVPVVDFRWSAICTNDQTEFKDETVSAFSPITTFTWNFGDGDILTGNAADLVPGGTHGGRTSGTIQDPMHQYSSNGNYTVVQTVTTLDGCVNTKTQSVDILLGGTTEVIPTDVNPYVQGFDTDNGGWFAESIRLIGGSKVDSSWQWINPTAATLFNSGATGNYWATTYRNGTVNPDTYVSGEGSVVNGPCFDLTQLERPMVSLDYWCDAEANLDGATLQYSTDGGNTWEIIGPAVGLVGADRDQGINWFNGVGIPSNPGNQPVGNYGWTGKQGGWKNARFNLDMIPNTAIARDQVRLRIGFSASDLNESSNTYDGFAFDNVFVGEKSKNVLAEHFTNATNSQFADTYLNNLFDDQITFRGTTDFNHIQYHVVNPGADLLNQQNPDDPSSRSLYYNLSQPPRTLMDGIVNPPKFVGNPTDLTRVEIDRRALEDPVFDLQLDTIATNNSETIGVELVLESRVNFNSPLIVQVALVEKTVTNAQGTFRNVLRKHLLGVSGLTLSNSFVPGNPFTHMQTDIPIDVPTVNNNQLMLVAYVQNKNTKEVYQSTVLDIIYKRGRLITSVEEIPEDVLKATLNEVQLFPNPANKQFSFSTPGELPSGITWTLADQRGVILKTGDFSKLENGLLEVEISSLPNGFYHVLLKGSRGEVVHKRLVVMNQN